MKKDPWPMEELKKRGHRRTATRTALIELFLKQEKPLAVPNLLQALAIQGMRVNKTTLYRELAFLQEQGIVTDVRLNERQVRYELADEYAERHHHHLVCTSCDRVEDVELPGDLIREEVAIESRTRFIIQRHVLEFFGLCPDCTKDQDMMAIVQRDRRITKQLSHVGA